MNLVVVENILGDLSNWLVGRMRGGDDDAPRMWRKFDALFGQLRLVVTFSDRFLQDWARAKEAVALYPQLPEPEDFIPFGSLR